jgi:hypothetical protein
MLLERMRYKPLPAITQSDRTPPEGGNYQRCPAQLITKNAGEGTGISIISIIDVSTNIHYYLFKCAFSGLPNTLFL